MSPLYLFSLLVALVSVQLIGLAIYSRHNARMRLAEGAINVDSSGVGKANIVLRSGWIVAMLAEVHLLARPFDFQIGLAAAVLAAAALGLRILSMIQLGRRWTLPTIVKPGEKRERRGIYSLLRHPNWVGVMIEIVAIPMIHGAWMTALLFGLLEAVLLVGRWETEEAALAGAELPPSETLGIDREIHVAIIGAGAAGLASAKILQDANVAFSVFERRFDVGGLWNADETSGVAQNTHLVSPKSAQAFSDQPMPTTFPTYPRHDLVLGYLRDYAQLHRIKDHIAFGTELASARRDGEDWLLTFDDGEEQRFTHLIVASGYHNKPKMPDFVGSLSGEVIHSRDYRGPASLEGKRVLVIGSGQSAMDVLCDAAAVAKTVFHSTRRGFICTPRYLMGKPTEDMMESPPPLLELLLAQLPLTWMFRGIAFMSNTVLRLAGTTNAHLGIPRYVVDDSPPPPTMDQRVYNFYALGDITHRGPVVALDNKHVEFANEKRDQIDLVVCGTGYQTDFPFLEPKLQPVDDHGHSVLRQQVFHHTDPTLFFVGLIHPIGAHWRVFEWQAQLIAAYMGTSNAQRIAFDLLSRGRFRSAQARNSKSVPMVNKLAYRRVLMAQRRMLVGN